MLWIVDLTLQMHVNRRHLNAGRTLGNDIERGVGSSFPVDQQRSCIIVIKQRDNDRFRTRVWSQRSDVTVVAYGGSDGRPKLWLAKLFASAGLFELVDGLIRARVIQ
jgi:hypothetical protein